MELVNMNDLDAIKDDVITTTQKELHHHDENLNTCGILKKWEYDFSNASKRGKRGLRSFVDVTAFFVGCLENALIPYDEILEKQFSSPFYLCVPVEWMI